MSNAPKSITVCICTFKRPQMLAELLHSVKQQKRDGFLLSIVVTDNDASESARSVVEDFAAQTDIKVTYCCETRQNIALARNAALSRATGEYIAFIDDDETPVVDWIEKMLATCETHHAAGVLGPVRPRFETPPPRWVLDGGFFDRPEHETGRIMNWRECRTGNLLFRRDIIKDLDEPFQPQFGTGGEDVDFFLRMTNEGRVFRWCNEAPAYETVPAERVNRAYLLKRALLRGRNVLKLPVNRTGLIMRSAIATPAYMVMLPIALLRGQHVFMDYAIRLCDHLGRLLAILGINPVSER